MKIPKIYGTDGKGNWDIEWVEFRIELSHSDMEKRIKALEEKSGHNPKR